MANEKTPVVWDDDTKKHRPLGAGEKMGGLDASSILSSDSGNLIQTGSDGLAYLSGSGMVDPRADNLIEDSANGKLQVTADRIAEWLDGHPQDAAALADAMNVVSGDAGNIVVQGSDKGAYLSNAQLAAAFAGLSDAEKQAIAAAVAGKMAEQLADGKTIVASGGKLASDPTNATAAQKAAINSALADADSGLVVDPSTGRLGVDFSSMPTDKFEALLKGLKMQIPLTGNMDLYVDVANGSDEIVDGRGAEALPFRTIQACAAYATQTYAVGPYWLRIRVKPGVYSEAITLPSFTRTSGGINITAYDPGNPPVLTNVSSISNVVSCYGGYWIVDLMNFAVSRTAPNDGLERFPAVIYVTSGGSLVVRAVSIVDSFLGAAPSSGHLYQKTVVVDGGATFNIGYLSTRGTSIEVHKGNASNHYVFTIYENSHYYGYSTNSATDIVDTAVSGEFDCFVDIDGQSLFSIVGGATYTPKFFVPSGASAVGKCYAVRGASGVSIPLTQTLPGSIEGTVDSATYAWYRGGSL